MRNLFIVVDGVGYDQIVEMQPTYLSARGRQAGLAPLKTLLAYSSGIYPSIWSGQYPDQHNVWTEFYLRDERQFAITALLGIIPGKYLPRKIAYVALAALQRLGVNRPEYYGIPPQLQAYFDRAHSRYWQLPPVAMPAAPLISQVFERNGQAWEYVFCDTLDARAAQRVREAASRVDTLIVCFAEMDKAGHEHGPRTAGFKQELSAFDARLAQLVGELEHQFPGCASFFFSDHGMTAVTDQFDAWSYLERRGFRLGRDYLAFINSTIISLWPDPNQRAALITALNQSEYGRVLSADERANHHVNFQHRRYGDELFVVHEGVELIPNFISLASRPNRGMHGYDPTCSSTQAFFIGGEQVEARPGDVVELWQVLQETSFAAQAEIMRA